MARNTSHLVKSLSFLRSCTQSSAPVSKNPKGKRKIFIYIDHSNFWIEPSYQADDQKWTYDVAGLRSLLIKHALAPHEHESDVLVQVNVYGYVLEHLGDMWEDVGAKVHGLRKSHHADLWNKIEKKNAEKEVDTSLVAHSVAEAVNAFYREDPKAKSTFVIVSGDRDMRPAVEKIIECKRTVHLWSWNNPLSRVYKGLDSSERLFTLHRLDDHVRSFVGNGDNDIETEKEEMGVWVKVRRKKNKACC
ncbi:hypothetical protein N0V84_006469 [Fusarium piperis]|uniref:NYN domain-containing protein n=1 Tax=Fusarium piperis TaxID=1435070 RepID=A0A9W8WBR6_9HYPO|nr:hypothetical protein N0V84_006469 [Fusarium piperis]